MFEGNLRKHSIGLGWAGLALGLSFSLTPASTASAAESGADKSKASETRILVDRGVASRRKGNEDEALQLFERAESTSESPSPRLLVHLAAVHQALGHWEQADQYLTRALTSPNDRYIQRHRPTLDEARRRIDRQIGTLEVRGGPAGAQVYLNGKLRGTLPLEHPLRITAGVYNLELQHPGHYTTTRSVALAGGATARESLTLTPIRPNDGGKEEVGLRGLPGQQATQSTSQNGNPAARQPQWLAWTLAGLSVGSAAGSAVAWTVREKHAERWNDDTRCLAGSLSRLEACGKNLAAGERAETWMYLSLAATGAFAVGSALKFLMDSPDSDIEDSAVSKPHPRNAVQIQCGVGPLSLACAGQF